MLKNKQNYIQIGELAKHTDTKVSTIRYYDEINLLKPSHIAESKYRYYKVSDIKFLLFVKKSQRLGFSLDEIKEIFSERKSGRSPCPKVRRLANNKIKDLQKKIIELKSLEEKLRKFITESKKIDTSCDDDDICGLIKEAHI